MFAVTKENFEEKVLGEKGKVLVDFSAEWCPHCKTLLPVVEEIAKENPQFKIGYLDIDTQKKLAIKLKVMSIPTLVVFENGKEVDRYVGGAPKEDIVKLLK